MALQAWHRRSPLNYTNFEPVLIYSNRLQSSIPLVSMMPSLTRFIPVSPMSQCMLHDHISAWQCVWPKRHHRVQQNWNNDTLQDICIRQPSSINHDAPPYAPHVETQVEIVIQETPSWGYSGVQFRTGFCKNVRWKGEQGNGAVAIVPRGYGLGG